MPQLQRRPVPDRENDPRNHAPNHGNHTRLNALLHLPIRYMVDEETTFRYYLYTYDTQIPIQKRKTRTLHRGYDNGIFSQSFTSVHISHSFTKRFGASGGQGIYGSEACLSQSFWAYLGLLVF